MILIKIVAAGCLCCVLSTLLPCTTAVAQSGYPEVAFDYSFVPFDRTCSEIAEYEIRPEWIEELESKMDTFRQTWQERGPRLLEITVEEIGKPFRQKEMQATMSLCRFPSMSLPLLLNMRRYLATATDNNPRDLHFFVALVFHELLHTYAFEILENQEASALLEKYEAEPFSVKTHVHLMALLKNTYLKSGYEEELRAVIELDSQLGPIYARSWEIVDELEDYRAFVDELKQ